MAKPVLCPTCNTITTQQAIDGTYRPAVNRCPTCWHFMDPVAYNRLAAQPRSQKETKVTYDEQVQLLYSGTNIIAKDVKYKLLEKGTGKVLVEGKTNDKGLTERVSTETPENIEMIVIRVNENKSDEEKSVTAYIRTNDKKDSVSMVYIQRGRVYFDIRYVNSVKDKAQSFIKAAETIKRKAGLRGFDKYKGDVWWSFDVTTECDITERWQELFALLQEYDMEVEEGHILTHASKSGEDGDRSGLEFVGCTEDGTLTRKEIEKMPKLKWSKASTLYLYGCRTGLPVSKSSVANNMMDSVADSFFLAQDVKTVEALRGYGYFSYSPTTYQAIADNVNDTRDIYLLAYKRGLNVNKLNSGLAKIKMDMGDDSLINPYVRRR